MGTKKCKLCYMWQSQDKPGAHDCEFCLNPESAFGFAYPDQCTIIWFILGGVAVLVTVILIMKFCNACTTCCGALMMCCRGKEGVAGQTVIIREGRDDEEAKPPIPVAKEVEMKKPRKSNVVALGDYSD